MNKEPACSKIRQNKHLYVCGRQPDAVACVGLEMVMAAQMCSFCCFTINLSLVSVVVLHTYALQTKAVDRGGHGIA